MTLTISNEASVADAVRPDLLSLLRQETRKAHRDLETSLDLLSPPFERSRFTFLLQRFLGFHLVWEEALNLFAGLHEIRAGRSRVGHLQRDLHNLGMSREDIVSTGRCAAAGALAKCEAEAVGSLYVMEGSTLGGKVISRAIEDAIWVPREGLTYFDPHGEKTGAMWRAFRDWCEAHSGHLDHAAVVRGAQRTFGTLQHWFAS